VRSPLGTSASRPSLHVASQKIIPASLMGHVVRHRRLKRRVSNDSFVDIDTVRYSVPFKLIRAQVEVLVGDDAVEVFDGVARVATHRRSSEPHARIVDPAHFDGLWRRAPKPPSSCSPLEAMGRRLSDYEAAIEVGS
jgi:hypothetical protein